MSIEEVKELKNKVKEAEEKNVKLMWHYANSEYKFIIILGYFSLFFLAYGFGTFLTGKEMFGFSIQKSEVIPLLIPLVVIYILFKIVYHFVDKAKK